VSLSVALQAVTHADAREKMRMLTPTGHLLQPLYQLGAGPTVSST